MKPQPWARPEHEDGRWRLYAGDEGCAPFDCPYGVVGDRLWVRETWSHSGEGVWSIQAARMAATGRPLYRATDEGPEPLGWWPSIHMPREFSRITLEITDVRVQRLQEISERDATDEGFSPITRDCKVPKFRELWDSINAKRAPWDSNPWVWALTFRRVAATEKGIAA